ncbi:MAG: hypothetical protein CL844_02090 [Crocinitomicaceae bacterium]|nr:hypothetical protein [Crocinitomicaceae bacterium]|tara:strand:+ start:28360 stop:28809 length:450 start_codon:yes stop_codon:yes gene_type:complete
MDLSSIISISGKPGLYKIVSQAKNSIIVESIIDKKRFPAYSSDKISVLDDISIYTHNEDKPLKDIFSAIYVKTEGKETLSHKEKISELISFISDIIPDYDEDRVYPSDIKKIFQWFNILINHSDIEMIKKADKKAASNSKEKKDTSKTK